MRLCHDVGPATRFLERHLPASRSLLNLVAGRAGTHAAWVRADDPADPRVVVARNRWLYLYSRDRQAGRCALESLPPRWQRRFAATPGWVWRYYRRQGRVGWQTRCEMYALADATRLRTRSRHRVSPLVAADAPLVTRYWPYGRRPGYVLERLRSGPSAAVRRRGRPVAWALTHSDGSMGFLHVLDEYRGQGMARSIGTWLARRQLERGIGAFVYIARDNRASISLTGSLGFEPVGDYVWFGP